MIKPTKTHKIVQAHYAEYARSSSACCTPINMLYTPETLQGLPNDIANFSAGSGNPLTIADLKPGENVLDLGSGGGLDCFLAAQKVGENGNVIGVDMTLDMLKRARTGAERLGLKNVEFREGFLEFLPVVDNSIDVVLSNCVVNLSPDKAAVMREVFRVLKPGGRIAISDILTNHPVSQAQREDNKDWCGCTSGALPVSEFEAILKQAGFVEIKLQPDFEVARQYISHGEFLAPKEITKEEALQALDNWEQSDHSMFIPHLITARKPI
jgi:arsenite methyltransferase